MRTFRLKRWHVLLLTALALVSIGLPWHADSAPEVMLETMIGQVLAEIRKDPDQLGDIASVRALADRFVLPHIDFTAVAQWVLGKHWHQADGTQRTRFVDAFRELLLNTYLRTINNYRENAVRIIPPRAAPKDNRATVDAEIEQAGGPPIHLNFRLHNPGNRWLIYDISVEGVSLVASHRSGFSREIQEQGLDGLIARLEKMNGSGPGAAETDPVPAPSSP